MELRQLAAFIRVAQFKEFFTRSKSLGYSQSAVTVQIRQLEEELDASVRPHGQAYRADRHGRAFFSTMRAT